LPRIEERGGDTCFTVAGKKLSGFSKAKTSLDTAMAKIAAEGKTGAFEPFRIHDLRPYRLDRDGVDRNCAARYRGSSESRFRR